MGGRAFKNLSCPRISPDVYAAVKPQTIAALRQIFTHVVVPTEMPEKPDYGDVDFLVSGPIHSPNSMTIKTFDWAGTVSSIKSAFGTSHGRRGYLTPDCMYFAIRPLAYLNEESGALPGVDTPLDTFGPAQDESYWIQIDVKVCFTPSLFAWQTFELNYASNSKMIGSMVKPLGLTLDPEGLSLRVTEIENTNWEGSKVWISKSPADVLKIVGLDQRNLDGGFATKEEIYEYFAGSWLFNPAHFAARLAEEKYGARLGDRSSHWMEFIMEWLPERYPGYQFANDVGNLQGASGQEVERDTGDALAYPLVPIDEDLKAWYKRTRAAVHEKVFTLFPHIAAEYYTKRATHLLQQEENRLQNLLVAAIPLADDGWNDDFPQPPIITKQLELEPSTPELIATTGGEPTPPPTPSKTVFNADNYFPSSLACSTQVVEPWTVPITLEALPRTPPYPCVPHPPPTNMSQEAKLTCIYRWTDFSPITGLPFLLSTSRKDFVEQWANATHAGAADQVLVDWVRTMWWHIWICQYHQNYVGMTERRMETEDKMAEKMRVEDEAQVNADEMVKARLERVRRGLIAMVVSV